MIEVAIGLTIASICLFVAAMTGRYFEIKRLNEADRLDS